MPTFKLRAEHFKDGENKEFSIPSTAMGLTVRLDDGIWKLAWMELNDDAPINDEQVTP